MLVVFILFAYSAEMYCNNTLHCKTKLSFSVVQYHTKTKNRAHSRYGKL